MRKVSNSFSFFDALVSRFFCSTLEDFNDDSDGISWLFNCAYTRYMLLDNIDYGISSVMILAPSVCSHLSVESWCYTEMLE